MNPLLSANLIEGTTSSACGPARLAAILLVRVTDQCLSGGDYQNEIPGAPEGATGGALSRGPEDLHFYSTDQREAISDGPRRGKFVLGMLGYELVTVASHLTSDCSAVGAEQLTSFHRGAAGPGSQQLQLAADRRTSFAARWLALFCMRDLATCNGWRLREAELIPAGDGVQA